MGLRFCFGASGSGKSHQIFEEVIANSMEDRTTDFLVIVPDQFTMQTQKEFVTRHPNGGILNIDVLSFNRLAHRILTEVGSEEKDALDDTGKCLLLRHLVGKMQDQLPHLGKQLRRPGYIQEVKSILCEFMQYGIEPQQLKDLSIQLKNRNALQYKLAELSVLYEEFIGEIRGKYATKEELPLILCRAISKSDLLKHSVVVFDGFTGFTPVQNKVIQELLVTVKDVIVTLVLDEGTNPYHINGEDELFYLSQKTVQSLMKLAEEAGVPCEEMLRITKRPVARYRDNAELAHLEKALFRYPAEAYEGKNEKISLNRMYSPMEEAKWIVCEMLRLTGLGYAYRDFAVVSGNPDLYQDVLREQFIRYQVPFYMDTTRSLKLNPMCEYIRSAIKIQIYDYAFDDVFHFLRCGIEVLNREETDILENYVCACGIHGRRMWEKPFTRLSRELLGNNAYLEVLNQMREKVVSCLAPLQSVENNESITVEQRIRAVYQLVTEAKIEKRLQEYQEKFQNDGDLAKAKEYEQIYRVVMDLLNQLYELIPDEVMDWKEFLELLDAGFAEVRIGTIPQSVDRVIVGDIERTRLAGTKVMFFIGMNDGIIPKNLSKGGILSDMDREYLSSLGEELSPTPRQKAYIQRLYLYLNMTKPTDLLYLSYSCVDAQLKALRPAYLIQEIEQVFPNLQTRQWMEKETVDTIRSLPDAAKHFSGLLREYSEGVQKEENHRLMISLYDVLRSKEESAQWAKELVNAAFMTYHENNLPVELVESLYGEILTASISSLEQYASCAYAHYLQYGLRLKERETYEFANVDLGNIYHKILVEFGEYLNQNHISWKDEMHIQVKQIDELTEKIATEYGESILQEGAQNSYRIEQLKRIMKRTITTIGFQLSKGRFEPYRYEVPFDKNIQIETQEGSKPVHLKGRIDRIDLAENDSKVFVKVVDYKSGSKDFDLEKLYYGLQLQLAVYLGRAAELAGVARSNKKVVPSAMLYYRVSDPIPNQTGASTDKTCVEEEISKALIPTGVLSGSEDSIQQLDGSFEGNSLVIPVGRKNDQTLRASKHVLPQPMLESVVRFADKKVNELGKAILEGDIRVNPCENTQINSCAFCAFKSACGFDLKIPGYEKRTLDGMSKADLESEIIGKEAEENGNS